MAETPTDPTGRADRADRLVALSGMELIVVEQPINDAAFDPAPCLLCGQLTRMRCARCGCVVCLEDNCPSGCDAVEWPDRVVEGEVV